MAQKKNVKEKSVNQAEQNEDKKSKSEKQSNLSWIIAGIIILAALFVILYYIFQSWGTIEYKELKFTREAYGNIYVYHYEYYFKGPENQIYKSNVYLRNDPRKNNIPVEGEISFQPSMVSYISVNESGLRNCPDSVIAVATLSQFLAHNLLQAKGATPDKEDADARNITYATCDTQANNTVLLMTPGEKTSIVKNTDSCYNIQIAQCEIMPAVEKFIVQSLIDARERFNAR